MRTIIYLRKSTDDSKHQKASIEDQRKWADEYVKNSTHALEVVRVFEEKKTAKEPWRPMFNEMMAMFYAGKADTVVTWDIDRLSRNEVDEGTIKWAIRQGKVKQVHTHNSIYTEHELLTMGIFLSLGAEEIAKMRQRVMRRMSAMIGEGKVPYRAPYGYENKDWGAIVRPEEESTLKKIFELRRSGSSFKQIAEHLNLSGISPRGRGRELDSGKWSHSHIEHIIKNEFYIGVVKFAGQIGEWVHDRIISRDLWDEANGRERVNMGYKKLDFPLKGIVVAEDGKPLKASLVKGKYVWYHTTGWTVKISQTEIFKELESLVEKWVFPPELSQDIEKVIKEVIDVEHAITIQEIADAKKRKTENDLRLSRIVRLYSIGGISDEEYQKERNTLIEDKRRIDDEESGFTALDQSLLEKHRKIVELLGNLATAYKIGDDTQRGCILKNTLVELVVDSEKRLTVKQKETFDDLFLLWNSDWQPQ